MAGFGIGFGALMDGVMKGGNFASGLKQQSQRNELLDMQIQDLKDERANKQDIRDISTAGVQEANQNTDGAMENVMNYYMKNTVPKIQQSYLTNGDVKTADAFGKWVQDANVQQGMRYGTNMIRAAHQNDPQGVMDNMVKLYNQPGYFEDGKSAVDAKIVNGQDGKPSGMAITLRDNKTGKDETHTFNSMKDVYDLAFQFGQPDQVFKYGMDQVTAGQKASAEVAKEDRDWQRTLTGKQIDQNNRMEVDANQSLLRQAEDTAKLRNGNNPEAQRIQARINVFKASGKDDAWISANMPAIVGIENKSRPVTSRMDDYIKLETETNREFAKLSQEEKIDKALKYISLQDKMTGDNQTLGLPDTTPKTTTAQPQGDGIPVFDTKTNSIIYR